MALAILGAILVFGLGIYFQAVAAARRLEAARAVAGDLEDAWEAVRAGVLPLERGPLETLPAPVPGCSPVAILLDVETTETPDLYRVRVIASYSISGRPVRRTDEALLWRP